MKKVTKSLYFKLFLGLFAFASNNLWCAIQKPVCYVETAQAPDEVQARQELAELMQILELRADAIFYAINESIIKNIESNPISKRDAAKKQTRCSMNLASTAYLLASENVKSHLDKLETVSKEKGAFTYSDIEKIVENDVLKSEKIHSRDFRHQSLAFQFRAIAEILGIKSRCQEMPFLRYIHMVGEIHAKTAHLINSESHILFLEELNISSDNIAQICKGLFTAHIRNIIELAFRSEIIVPSAQVRYTSAKIEAHKKKLLDTIAREREVTYSRLLTLDEIKELISQQLARLPEKLRLRILALTNPENSASLIHYIQIWGEQLIRPMPRDTHMQYFLTLSSKLESFKKILSGIDLKNEITGADPKNIWPNLVANLELLNFTNLIKQHSSEPGCSKAAAESKEHKELTQAELKAEQLAKDLIAEEETAKKHRKTKKQKAAAKKAAEKSESVAKRKEEEAPSVTITPRVDLSKQKQKRKEQDAPSVTETLHQPNPELLQHLASTSSPAAAAPTVKIEAPVVCAQQDLTVQIQDPEIEEALKLGSSETQPLQELLEPENTQDQISKKYNCIVDLSRGTTGYQCKIFLHPKAAGSSVNFLANLDYSRLPKYKNPRDNNHAFSNLVEKHYGNLGVISSQRTTGNGWIVIRISFPGRITWIGHAMEDACQLSPNGTFEFVIMKRDMNPDSYARCVHRFFRPN